jgi:2-isopropylmalate synthase
VIEIGPMSGRSNVTYWLEKRGLTVDDALVDRILQKAKRSSTVLTEVEIRDEIEAAAAAKH